ncbi:unnamed protein product [Trifolium pratense]|uniref:Uncharacterized protein n=1 Tax=Trifolium pratense TaxID=57577 RepID=A0ACB0K1X8_TRIPR|nr:unnamed protein product [Trifolium pratense]
MIEKEAITQPNTAEVAAIITSEKQQMITQHEDAEFQQDNSMVEVSAWDDEDDVTVAETQLILQEPILKPVLMEDIAHIQQAWATRDGHATLEEDGPWMFLGDFNAVLGAHEKRGRRLPPKASCADFLLWTNANSLTHLNTIGAQLTWTNGRLGLEHVALRLDRSIVNMQWIDSWHNLSCCTLIRHSSDHHPVLITQELSIRQHASPFRFLKVWTTHADCASTISLSWQRNNTGDHSTRLQRKLKGLKRVLKDWNKRTFGNINSKVS